MVGEDALSYHNKSLNLPVGEAGRQTDRHNQISEIDKQVIRSSYMMRERKQI